MKSRIRTFLATAFLVLGCIAAKAAPIITNGGFETGDFTGWTVATTGTAFVDWSVNTAGAGSGFGMAATSPQEGSYDAWNGYDGAGPMTFTMYQDVPIPSGPTALLSWVDRVQWNFALTSTATQPRLYDVKILDPGTNSVLGTLYSFSTGTALVLGDTGWQSHTADLSAFGGSTVRLLFSEQIPESFTGPGQIEFDAISLSTPEPGTLALLGLGLAGLAASRRRKQ